MKRIYWTIAFAFVALTAYAQTGTPYTFKEIGWSFTAPPSFFEVEADSIQSLENKGEAAFKKEFGDSFIIEQNTKRLLWITDGKYNTLNAFITPFDVKIDGDWYEINKALKDATAQTYFSQMPNFKVDTLSTREQVGGIEFDLFVVKVTHPNRTVIKQITYSRLMKGYDFGVNFVILDERIGKEMLAAWKKSKFK